MRLAPGRRRGARHRDAGARALTRGTTVEPLDDGALTSRGPRRRRFFFCCCLRVEEKDVGEKEKEKPRPRSDHGAAAQMRLTGAESPAALRTRLRPGEKTEMARVRRNHRTAVGSDQTAAITPSRIGLLSAQTGGGGASRPRPSERAAAPRAPYRRARIGPRFAGPNGRASCALLGRRYKERGGGHGSTHEVELSTLPTYTQTLDRSRGLALRRREAPPRRPPPSLAKADLLRRATATSSPTVVARAQIFPNEPAMASTEPSKSLGSPGARFTKEYLEEERELMCDMAAQYQRTGDRFEKFQRWVRQQLEEKGTSRLRVRLRQLVTQEQWNVMFGDLKLDEKEEEMIRGSAAGVAAARWNGGQAMAEEGETTPTSTSGRDGGEAMTEERETISTATIGQVGGKATEEVGEGDGMTKLPMEEVGEGDGMTKLPMEEVEWILNHTPRIIEHEDEDRLRWLYPKQEEFEKNRDTMRRAVEAAASAREEFLAYQAWVHAECNDKGYVAVDDAFLASREEMRQWAGEQFGEMLDRVECKFSPSDIGDYSGMYATDDDEEEEEPAACHCSSRWWGGHGRGEGADPDGSCPASQDGGEAMAEEMKVTTTAAATRDGWEATAEDREATPTVAASRDGKEAKTEDGEGFTILLMEEVEWIMSYKPRVIEHEDEERLCRFYPQEEVFEKTRSTMHQAVEAAASVREKFIAFQSWVRMEYNNKGFVAVDGKFLAGREQVRQWSSELFEDMFDRLERKVSPSDIGDYSDMYAMEDEELAAVDSK
ncbi:hypothetical protein HU200_044017 [Digitaria exilis]|uniref:Uncharacterized protein n=1 Tax=Digitaria exilis TaxID=1010633 RepID=A0A835BA62_9POAL|nr:hypothetical protein HU200_044017 [Digitaria exilis]